MIKKYNILEYEDGEHYSTYINMYHTNSKLIMIIIVIIIKLMGRKLRVRDKDGKCL